MDVKTIPQNLSYSLSVGDSSQDHLALIDQSTQTELQVYFIIPEKLLN